MENQKKTFETYLKSVKNLRNQRKSYEIMQKTDEIFENCVEIKEKLWKS